MNTTTLYPDIKVYVGCSLTPTSTDPDYLARLNAFKFAVAGFKEKLRPYCEVLEFLGTVVGTPRDVWNWDIERCVKGCHFMIGIADQTSTGLGIEIGTMATLGKPIIIAAQKDAVVTRLVLDPAAPNCEFTRYDDFDHLLALVLPKIKAIWEQLPERNQLLLFPTAELLQQKVAA